MKKRPVLFIQSTGSGYMLEIQWPHNGRVIHREIIGSKPEAIAQAERLKEEKDCTSIQVLPARK